jgi:hypothetical protein
MTIDERMQVLVEQFDRSPEDLGARRAGSASPESTPPDPRSELAALRGHVDDVLGELRQRVAAAEERAVAAETRAAAAEARADDALRIVEWLALAAESPTNRPRTA